MIEHCCSYHSASTVPLKSSVVVSAAEQQQCFWLRWNSEKTNRWLSPSKSGWEDFLLFNNVCSNQTNNCIEHKSRYSYSLNWLNFFSIQVWFFKISSTFYQKIKSLKQLPRIFFQLVIFFSLPLSKLGIVNFYLSVKIWNSRICKKIVAWQVRLFCQYADCTEDKGSIPDTTIIISQYQWTSK